MVVFAKKRMPVSEWTDVRRKMAILYQALSEPHDLMMFSVTTNDVGQDDIYIGLPDEKLLAHFPGFERVDRSSLPDYLITLVVREDGFAERFPDIARKRRAGSVPLKLSPSAPAGGSTQSRC